VEAAQAGAAGGGTPRRKPGRLSFKEQLELDGMESAVLAAEERKAALEMALSDPATYRDSGDQVSRLRRELVEASEAVDVLYVRWQELESLRAGA
jgi:ATP-binding cassette subfamily F protein uup